MATTPPTIQLPETDEEVPRVGQGTWKMEEDDREEAVQTLRRGVALGANLIDTAEMYGSGEVEEIVGEAIDGIRDEVFLTTKVLPRNASREGAIEACKRSLDRLGTDHVDLYLLHWSSSHPIEETMAAFRELIEEGLTRYVGVSNLTLAELDRAQLALGDEHPLVVDQILYWLGARNAENALLPGLEERGVLAMTYSPFGHGTVPEPGTDRREALEDVAGRHDATVHQIMLAWVLRHDNLFTIPKTSSIEHLEENLAATEIELTDADLDRLDEAYPPTESSRIQTL